MNGTFEYVERRLEAQQSEPRKGQDRFTAERVLRTRPKTYRAIVLLLAEPDAKIEHIAQRHRVSTHTVRAIRARESIGIAERKNTLAAMLANVAGSTKTGGACRRI